MRVLALSGQRTAALAQFTRCRAILADELGVDPDAETLALYEAIRIGKLGAVPLIARFGKDGRMRVHSVAPFNIQV